jgi:hypothetical protein
VWGATNVQELRIRHNGGAPERFAYEGAQYLEQYANESGAAEVDAIKRAAEWELPKGDDRDKGWANWLGKRGFTKPEAEAGVKAAVAEEGEARSLWDIVNGITASARAISHTNDRVELEAKAGNLMRMVAA